MPQFQLLPNNPGFGEQLGASLGGGLSQGMSSALGQMLQEKKNKKSLESLRPLLSQSGLGNEEIDGLVNSNLNPDQVFAAVKLSSMLGGAGSEKQDIGQSSFNRMAEILEGGNLGLGSKVGSKVWGGQKAEDVGEFESLNGSLEALLKDKVNTGALSNAKFKYITETLLPKPNDREATIRGKLKALAQQLGFDPSVLGVKKNKSNKDEDTSRVLMRDPAGVLRNVPKDQAKEAQKAGYKLDQ